MSSTSSCSRRLTSATSWTASGPWVVFTLWRMRWAIWATDMRPVARSSIRAGCTPGVPARLWTTLVPRLERPRRHLDAHRIALRLHHLGLRLPGPAAVHPLERLGGRLHVEDV